MAQSQFSIQAFIFIFILIIYVLTAHFIDIRKITFLHQSSVAIFMGFITALVVKYALNNKIIFNNDIFFTIILPPIIFSAGYSLRKSLFFQNFGMISFLGIFGTIIGFLCLVFCLNFLDNIFFNKLTTRQVLMLASVLCATDTVAAMSLIKPERFPVLNAVLFGQGIINDAVAIILFRTVQKIQLGEGGVFYILIGMGSGFGVSYLLKVNDSFIRSPIKETSLILLTGYATYLLGQLCGFSGILALFTCGIIMGHYTFMNISQQSQRGTGLAFQTVSYVAEAFIYAYLGASILSVSGQWSAIIFALFLILSFPIIRALMVYLLPCIYKITKRSFPLKSNQLKICWYSGLVRGVIAFALALQIQSKNVGFIQTVSVVIVMFTTIIGSSLLKSFMKCIGMDQDEQIQQINPSNMQEISDLIFSQRINDKLLLESEYNKIQIGHIIHTNNEQPKNISFKKRFEQFEQNYVVPIFKKSKNEFSYQMTNTSSQKKMKQAAI